MISASSVLENLAEMAAKDAYTSQYSTINTMFMNKKQNFSKLKSKISESFQ